MSLPLSRPSLSPPAPPGSSSRQACCVFFLCCARTLVMDAAAAAFSNKKEKNRGFVDLPLRLYQSPPPVRGEVPRHGGPLRQTMRSTAVKEGRRFHLPSLSWHHQQAHSSRPQKRKDKRFYRELCTGLVTFFFLRCHLPLLFTTRQLYPSVIKLPLSPLSPQITNRCACAVTSCVSDGAHAHHSPRTPA